MLGLCWLSSADKRARPPAVVSPLILALTTVTGSFSVRSLSSSKATHPLPRLSPYSALKESPTTKTVSVLLRAAGDWAWLSMGKASKTASSKASKPGESRARRAQCIPHGCKGFATACVAKVPRLLKSLRARRLLSVVFIEKAVMSETNPVERPEAAPVAIISVEHVFKSVTDSTGTLTILRDIDFSLSAKETAAIVGASGSGKSTLLSIIAGLDTPTKGTVRLAGQDIFAINEDDRAALRAQKVGFVFQSFQLMANLTALENVMLPLELSGTRGARALATEMLGRVGLGQRLGHYPKVLSGGEQQRVALARAFVVQPAVLLADEPTGSLDFATGETVMKLMFELNQELGTTLVLVTHDQSIAAQCQRKITIEAGQVVPQNL